MSHLKQIKTVMIAIAAVTVFGGQASALPTEVISPTGYYTQIFPNGGSSGFWFTTGSDPNALTVYDLGYLNFNFHKTTQALSASHDIAIYRVSDHVVVVSATIPAGITSPGSTFAYVSVATPVTLLANTQYAIAGTEYAPFGNDINADPLAVPTAVPVFSGYVFDGSAYTSDISTSGVRFPDVHNGDLGYFGPNFRVGAAPAAVPEPAQSATLALGFLMLIGVLFFARKRKANIAHA